MEAAVTELTWVGHGRRDPDARMTHRNGYRERRWDTRVGTIDLAVPRVRAGSYLLSLLGPRRRTERALLAVLQEAYVSEVSTRRIDDLVRAMGIDGISTSPRVKLRRRLGDGRDHGANAVTRELSASRAAQMRLSAAAAMPVCESVLDNYFLGDGTTPSGLKGVYSEIENIGELLCTQPASPKRHSWSLAWVSLDGPQDNQTPGVDIYQGGYATCPPPEVGSCPYNSGNRYIWTYYGREQGACGLAFNTGFKKIVNATVYDTHFFQISKVGSDYNFYYDEIEKDHRVAADIDTCWPGVVQAEWKNEMLNRNDQAGGRVANPQNFGNNQYQTASGWHDRNRTLGAACIANSYPAHWHCEQSSSVANYYIAWDDRVP